MFAFEEDVKTTVKVEWKIGSKMERAEDIKHQKNTKTDIQDLTECGAHTQTHACTHAHTYTHTHKQ